MEVEIEATAGTEATEATAGIEATEAGVVAAVGAEIEEAVGAAAAVGNGGAAPGCGTADEAGSASVFINFITDFSRSDGSPGRGNCVRRM